LGFSREDKTGGYFVKSKLTVFSFAILFCGDLSFADIPAAPLDNADACMEGPLAQFGRYIGNWDIQDSQLSQDGQTWTKGDGAQWNFVCLGNGTAIQDFWLPPDGNVGTNLRTWNSKTESWDIAWAINTQPGFAHIQAKEDEDGNIVMHYKSPLPDPLRRITFFPPDEKGWNWKLEFSQDGGETWFEVYRITATPHQTR
jgi:hypothetical protein